MTKTVHVVPHQHFDLIWRRKFAWYSKRRAEIFIQALDQLRRYPGYTFTFSQAMPIREFLTDFPQYRDEFTKNLHAGRLEILGGCESICDLNMSSPAAIIANIESGLNYFRKEFNYQVTAGAFEDAFGVPDQLPSVLKMSGYRFYKAGRMPRTGHPDLSGDFIWRAKSGDSIRCVSPETGNSDWGWGYSHNPDDPARPTMSERRGKVLESLLSAAFKDTSDVLYFMTGEEHDIVEKLPELLDQASAVTGAAYKFSTCNRYYDSLPESHWKNAPVYDSATDLSRLFTGCYTSRIGSKLHARKLEYGISSHNFNSLDSKPAKLPRSVNNSLFLLQFHDSICGCHIDENASVLERRFSKSDKVLSKNQPAVAFKTRIPDFKTESKKVYKPDTGKIKFGKFHLKIAQGQLNSVEFSGCDYGNICELAAREDSGTLWTEEYSGGKFNFAGQEMIDYVSIGPNNLDIVTKFQFDDFKSMWPGFSMLNSRKRMTFNKNSSFVSVKFEIFWMGGATELSVRWTAAGDKLKKCLVETPFGSRERTPCQPSTDTMTGDAFPVLNWCRTGKTAIFNRGTPGHALRGGGIETIILRSPVKRWSPWFPVTPSDQSRDNGNHAFEFLVDLGGGKRSAADLHRTGIEYNLGDNVSEIKVDAFALLPDNIVIAGAHRDEAGCIHALLFEAEGHNSVWKDSNFRIGELFKPYQIKKCIIVDGSKIHTSAGLGKRRRAISPVA